MSKKDRRAPAVNMTITAKYIFNYIQMLNPRESHVSSIGSFISQQHQEVSDNLRSELSELLPEGSLASKILMDAKSFTDKQLWVISFEALKNAEFVAKMDEFYSRIEREDNAKRLKSKAKKAANKESSQDVLDSVKNSGKKLGDYYRFLMDSKKYAREYYSKKFTSESANEFINL